MGNDTATKKDIQGLQKQWEGLRDRHNTLEQEVHRIDGNVDRLYKDANGRLPQQMFDSNWATLMKRLDAIEASVRSLDASHKALEVTVATLDAAVKALQAAPTGKKKP